MHWIESLFGVSPDGDSGATELVLLGVALVAILAGLLYLRRRFVRRATPRSRYARVTGPRYRRTTYRQATRQTLGR